MWMKLLLVAVPVLGVRILDHVERAVRVLVLVVAIVSVYGIWQHFAGWDLVRGIRTYQEGSWYTSIGFFSHHLSYGGQLMLALIFAVAWAADSDRPRPWGRGYDLVPVALIAVTLVWTYTRSALIGAAAGVFVILLTLKGRTRAFALTGVAAGLSTLVASPDIRQRFTRIVTGGEETRLNLWESSVNGIAARPWLGFGHGNFPYLMENHGVEGYYEVQGHAHNDFLMHAVNAGLLGLASALALLFVVVLLLWKAWRQGGRYGWLLLGGLAAQVGITAAGLFQVYQTDDEVEMTLYFLLGCGLAVVTSRFQRNGPETTA
jgi:O-antigen ligase